MPALFRPTPGVNVSEGRIDSRLTVNSVLADLPLHVFNAEIEDALQSVAVKLRQQSQLPGVLVHVKAGSRVAIARSLIFEALAPTVEDLAIPHPTATLRTLLHPELSPLCLKSDTLILDAACQVLRRPLHQQTTPIVVDTPAGSMILSATVLNQAYWYLRGIDAQIRDERLQLEQLQHEKMAALGRLVDSVAHEILDPISFIWGNLSHISSYTQTLLELVEAYAEEVPHPSTQLQQRCDDAELDYLQTDLPEAVRSVRGGADRLRQLAISLQNFCHIDEVYPKPADLHSLLDSLLLLLQSHLKTPLQIYREYGKLPPVQCFAGQLGQVFISILTSMTDALLAQHLASGHSPALVLSTRVCNAPEGYPSGRWIEVLIQDNGPGLPASVEKEMAEACSTQVDYIKETRLTMSHRIVTAKHGGCFQVRSQQFTQPVQKVEKGTEFQVLLPLMPPDG